MVCSQSDFRLERIKLSEPGGSLTELDRAYLRLYAEAFKECLNTDNEQQQLRRTQGHENWAVIDGTSVIGIASMRRIMPVGNGESDLLWITAFVVEKSRRLQGIGGKMLGEIMVLAAEIGISSLRLVASSEESFRFFRSQGFSRLEHGNSKDWVTMTSQVN